LSLAQIPVEAALLHIECGAPFCRACGPSELSLEHRHHPHCAPRGLAASRDHLVHHEMMSCLPPTKHRYRHEYSCSRKPSTSMSNCGTFTRSAVGVMFNTRMLPCARPRFQSAPSSRNANTSTSSGRAGGQAEIFMDSLLDPSCVWIAIPSPWPPCASLRASLYTHTKETYLPTLGAMQCGARSAVAAAT
jgi:hypothetical protein